MCNHPDHPVRESVERCLRALHDVLLEEMRGVMPDVAEDIPFHRMYLMSDPRSLVSSISGAIVSALESDAGDQGKLEELLRILEDYHHLKGRDTTCRQS